VTTPSGIQTITSPLNPLNPFGAQQTLAPLIEGLKSLAGSTLLSVGNATGLDTATLDQLVQNFDVGAVFTKLREGLCQALKVLTQCQPCKPDLLLGVICANGAVQLFDHISGDFIGGWDAAILAYVKLRFNFMLGLEPVKKVLKYLMSWACPVEIYSVGEAFELVHTNQITVEHGRCLWRMAGRPPKQFDFLLLAKRTKLNAKEVIEFSRRYPEAQIDPREALKGLGWHLNEEIEAYLLLYDKVPELKEAIPYTNRAVNSRQVIDKYGLLQGFVEPSQYGEVEDELWANPSADTGRPTLWDNYGQSLLSHGTTRKEAALAWMSSRKFPGLGEASTMVHRLRQSRVGADNKWDIDNCKDALFAEGYPPQIIEAFIQIVYQPITIRYLKPLYLYDAIDKEELIERLQDLGYDLQSSTLVWQALDYQKRRTLAGEIGGFTVSKVLGFFKAGLYTSKEAKAKITDLGFSEDDAQEGIDATNEEVQLEIMKLKVAAAKKCFLTGSDSTEQAATRLTSIGVDSSKIHDLLGAWQLERQCSEKDASQGEVLTGFRKGLLDAGTVVAQLRRQNISDATISLLIAEAQLQIEKDAEGEAAKQTKMREQVAKQIENQLVQQEKGKKRKAKIQLNLDVARRKAEETIAKADRVNKQRSSDLSIKKATQSAIASIKSDGSAEAVAIQDQLLSDLATAKSQLIMDTATRKAKYEVDKVGVKDKTEQADLLIARDDDILGFKQTYIQAVETAKQTAKDAVSQLQQDIKGQEGDAKASELEQISQEAEDAATTAAQDVATLISEDAKEKADVDELP